MAEYLPDGTYDFSLGQDAWHDPEHIRPNQYAAGVNVTTKGGKLSPRPAFWELERSFEKKTLTTSYGHERTLESIWRTGKFQAAIPYASAPFSYAILIISGLIYRMDLDSGMIVLLTEEFTLNQFSARINWSYAADKIIIYDFPDYPLIIDGDDVRRSDPDKDEVPISVLGTYNENRLFVANAGVEFTAGDAVGNLATPDAPVTFTEIFTPNSPFYRQQFSLPVEEAIHPIVAMGFIQQLDSSTGIGPMFVATDEKFYFYQTNQPRAQWGVGSQFGGILLANAGLAGARSFINVNSDLIFVDPDARIRALSTSRNESQRWSNVPISREVDNWMKLSDPTLAQFAVLGYFDNKIYITANPYRIKAETRNGQPVTDYAHGGFVVLELDSMSSFLSEGTPVWAGLWTGINPVEFFTVNKRAFVVSKDGCGGSAVNAIYEIKSKSKVDVVRGNERRIRSIVYTKEYNSGNPLQQKKQHSMSLFLSNVSRKFNLNVEYRPGNAPNFLQYNSWSYQAPTENCNIPKDGFFNGLAKHTFKEVVLGDPVEAGCSPVDKDDYKIYYTIQYRITLEGDWSLKSVRTKATPYAQEERQQPFFCKPQVGEEIPLKCNTDWMIPGESVCQP